MTTCNQGSHLHDLKWEACKKWQDGTDPVTLFLQVTGLIDITNKNEKRETEFSISPDPTASCHAEMGRATNVKLFLSRGAFIWHYWFLALSSPIPARMLCGFFTTE